MIDFNEDVGALLREDRCRPALCSPVYLSQPPFVFEDHHVEHDHPVPRDTSITPGTGHLAINGASAG